MHDNGMLACSLLQSYNFAVLRRTAPRQYAFYGYEPPFYAELFPAGPDGPCSAPWNFSPMLEFFLDDAENFFTGGQVGMLSSGSWQEDGKTDEAAALMAMAHSGPGGQCIVVRLMQEEYQEKVGILRQARAQLLENRFLSQNLEIFKEKSKVDALTGLFNRRAFIEFLEEELARYKADDSASFAMLLLDVDDFKKINDTYGHLVGDEVLRALGRQLLASMRREDMVARYGGEEFIMLVSGVAAEQIMQIGEKIRQGVESLHINARHVEDQQGKELYIENTLFITLSIGCSVIRPQDDAESVIRRADEALYSAKKSGKNMVCFR